MSKQVKIRLSADDIRKSGFNKNIDDTDIQAFSEDNHIKRANNIHRPTLRKYYFCDGFKFNTGNKHRNGGHYVQ